MEDDEDDDDVDVNERDRDGCTPLHVALLNGQVECARVLLGCGAAPFTTLEGSPALHVAISSGAIPHFAEAAAESVALLIEHAADALATDDYGRSPLHLAAGFGLTRITAALLERYPNPNAAAAAEGEEDAPDPINARDRYGWTPLHHACYGGHEEEVVALLGRGAKPARVSKAGCTALHAAVVGRSQLAVGAVLAADASVAPATCIAGGTALDMAEARGYPQIAALLRGEDPAGVEAPAAPPPPVIIAPDECFLHHTCAPITRSSADPPPENVNRLQVLLHRRTGILRGAEFAGVDIVSDVKPATMADVLRVHEYPYVRKIQRVCERIPEWTSSTQGALGTIDGDTEVCRGSFGAALCAAGAVVEAVDRVVAGSAERVFCAVRPPGHHAGPNGPVPAPGEPVGSGSHGFCLLNNVALGAAYARCVHRHSLRRVAIVDFDVHHGNGTEAVVQNTTPAAPKFAFSTPYCDGSITVPTYRPWLDETDHDEVFFASVHGYGRGRQGSFYPGSGPTADNRNAEGGEMLATQEPAVWREEGVVEDPASVAAAHDDSTAQGALPWVIDVGMEGTGKKAERGAAWRRVWRGKTLPAIAAFKPDLIFISAGFDAHAKDEIQGPVNLGVKEADYEWLTEELCKIANTSCQGRIISVLEGGYRIQGGVVSAFGRSVAAHLRVMFRDNREGWNTEACQKELDLELKQRRLGKEAQEAARAASLEAARLREEAAILAAQAAAAAAKGGGERGEEVAAAASMGDGVPSKRRRKEVDYTQLNAQLEMESNGAAAAVAPAGAEPQAVELQAETPQADIPQTEEAVPEEPLAEEAVAGEPHAEVAVMEEVVEAVQVEEVVEAVQVEEPHVASVEEGEDEGEYGEEDEGDYVEEGEEDVEAEEAVDEAGEEEGEEGDLEMMT